LQTKNHALLKTKRLFFPFFSTKLEILKAGWGKVCNSHSKENQGRKKWHYSGSVQLQTPLCLQRLTFFHSVLFFASSLLPHHFFILPPTLRATRLLCDGLK
jgi:hypothetical protein